MKIDKFSPKQREVLSFITAPESMLIADGSVRSGKTTIMSMAFVIWAMEYFRDTNFGISGKTVTSAERNIIKPLEQIENLPYTLDYHRSDRLLTVKCGSRENSFYVFGGKDESSYALIQGITLAGVLLDEVALMPQSFVDQAIARTLTFANAKIWFNCNPSDPNHWFHEQYIQTPPESSKRLHFLMQDNPIMGPAEIKKASRMFTGVFYKRYILGLWVRAEGVIFRQFADDPSRWVVDSLTKDDLRQIGYITFGVDFGESTSHTVFVATGILRGARGIVALDENKMISKGVAPDKIESEFVAFVRRVSADYPGIRLTYAFCDHPETIVNGINNAVRKAGIPLQVVMAKKEEINTRIFAQERMLNLGLVKILSKCTILIHSLKNQVWAPKKPDEKKSGDIRLDNDPNIADIADAWEYSWEKFIDEIGVRE